MKLNRLFDALRTVARQGRSVVDVLGAMTLLAGLTIGLGWLLQDAELARLGTGETAPVLATALCLTLGGIGLIVSGRAEGSTTRAALPWLGALVLTVAGLALAEAVLDLELGIDLPALHRWLSDANPHPGRMAPLTGIAFAMLGAALLLLGRAERAATVGFLELPIFALILCGVVGILSHWLDIEALYGWRNATRIALPTAIGLTVLGVGAWLRVHELGAVRADLRDEWALTIIAGEILTVIALVAGLSGFAILQRSIVAQFADTLGDHVADRTRSFETLVRATMETNAIMASRPALIRLIDRLDQVPDDGARAALAASAKSLLDFGFRRASYLDAHGRELVAAGEPPGEFDLAVRLYLPEDAHLAWGERGFVVVARLPMTLAGKPVGTLVTERYLPALTTAYHDVERIGVTADTRICAIAAAGSVCFPSARSPIAIVRPAALEGRLLPMARALGGQTGFAMSRNARDETVIVAYAPIGTLGMGMTLQIEVSELYAPIRRQLEIVAPSLLALVALGTLLLCAKITPLARRLREMATTDGLTGALNRRTFMRLADSELGIARRYRRPFAILMLDADHFKKVNDGHGHDAGDAVLRILAATCRRVLRDVDLFGRLGGEEFAVALPETPAAKASLAAERLRAALADAAVACDGKLLRFTVSIGVAAAPEIDGDVSVLLKAADQALYAAKQGGRNRVVLAGDAPEPLVEAATAEPAAG